MAQVTPALAPGLVPVSRWGFFFCRWLVTLLLWIALAWGFKILVAVSAAVLLFNALVGIERAPLLRLGAWLSGRWAQPETTPVDRQSIRYAHILAGGLLVLCAILLYAYPTSRSGWTLLLWLAVFKTLGAMGFCCATRLFSCLRSGGTCCAVLRRKP